MVRYSIPMIPNGMTWSAVNFIDRYAILIVCGASTAGLFTAAGKLPAVINMISMIAQQSLQILLPKKSNLKTRINHSPLYFLHTQY